MRCPDCGSDLIMFSSVDAYGCSACNEWQEDKCSDTTCEYCIDRRDSPRMQQWFDAPSGAQL